MRMKITIRKSCNVKSTRLDNAFLIVWKSYFFTYIDIHNIYISIFTYANK